MYLPSQIDVAIIIIYRKIIKWQAYKLPLYYRILSDGNV